jgi:prephenate dehydrogenase
VRAHVVGLGLVGSSIGLGLAARGYVVTGYDIDPAVSQRALEIGAVGAISREVPESGLGFVATPAAGVPGVVRELLSAANSRDTALPSRGSPGLVVTDVAGVKASIAGSLPLARFVPGHPMAGSEQEGPDGADPNLFVGATWVLTPTHATAESAYAVVRRAVGLLGAEIVVLPPERHDDLVAIVSHVPHLTAATLMALAGGSDLDRDILMRLAAGGFRDMTRIAAGSPAIWPDICKDNSKAIVSVLDELIGRLGEVRRFVENGQREDLIGLLRRAQAARQNLPARGARPTDTAELRVVVPDRPGVLAAVTSLAGGLGANIYDIEIAHSVEGPRGVLVLVVSATTAEPLSAALKSAGYAVATVAARIVGADQ